MKLDEWKSLRSPIPRSYDGNDSAGPRERIRVEVNVRIGEVRILHQKHQVFPGQLEHVAQLQKLTRRQTVHVVLQLHEIRSPAIVQRECFRQRLYRR